MAMPRSLSRFWLRAARGMQGITISQRSVLHRNLYTSRLSSDAQRREFVLVGSGGSLRLNGSSLGLKERARWASSDSSGQAESTGRWILHTLRLCHSAAVSRFAFQCGCTSLATSVSGFATRRSSDLSLVCTSTVSLLQM